MKIKLIDNASVCKERKIVSFNNIRTLVNLMMTKRLNLLIGSGCSASAIPLCNNIKGSTEKIKFEKLKASVKNVSTQLIFNEMDNNVDKVLNSYITFFNLILKIVYSSNSRIIPKSAYIFTTNYDLFIEKAFDRLLSTNNFF